ncbi:MAG: phospho-N-acetylmuramoyl-pentapeptide-transferase [Pseudomonadota bacterium]
MLYHLLYPLHTIFSGFNVFRYITFRSIYAVLTALLFTFILGPWAIRKLKKASVGQYVREDGPATHLSKKGTPTMGGLLIIFVIATSTLLWADLTRLYVWAILAVIFGFGAIGFLDDYKKLKNKKSAGLKGWQKITLQSLFALVVAYLLYHQPGLDSRVTIPFLKDVRPDIGWGYIIFASLVIVGTSNAVNLTDGLDGLAIGATTVATATMLIFSYVAGHAKIAGYLQIPYVPGSGELAVVCGSVVGAGMGFLWFNAHPAEVFMGDVGSLPLGAMLGTLAVITKQEILLIVIGGIFAVEALSVIFQVGFLKLTRGRRIFKMAPLHHHFELKGWPESKVIVRFWLIAIMLGLLSLSTLKIR